MELLDAVAADVRPESVRVALGAIAAADLRDVLPRVAVPTLLVWGELDARSPLSVAREFARAIPHAELVVIPGAGHMSNLERPDEFNAAVRTFCRRVGDAPGLLLPCKSTAGRFVLRRPASRTHGIPATAAP